MMLSDFWRNALLPVRFDFKFLQAETSRIETMKFKPFQAKRKSKSFLQILDWSYQEQSEHFY